MPSLFSRLKHKDGAKSKKKGADLDSFTEQLPKGPQWTDAWTRTSVEPEEVVELIILSTEELKSRGMTSIWTLAYAAPTLCACAVPTCHRIWWLGHLAFFVHPDCLSSESLVNSFFPTALDIPFFLLPFRPTSDPSAVRTFVRHFFDKQNGGPAIRGEALQQELRMTEPMVRFPDKTSHHE